MCVYIAPLQTLVLFPLLPRKRGRGRPAKPAPTLLTRGLSMEADGTLGMRRRRGAPTDRTDDLLRAWLARVNALQAELCASGKRATVKAALQTDMASYYRAHGASAEKSQRMVAKSISRMEVRYHRAKKKILGQ